MNTITYAPGTMAATVTSSNERTPAASSLATEPAQGIGHASLRRAVHARVFGDADPVRVGRYTVLERVGSGAMAVVYAAFDRELDRKVAIKILRPERTVPHERLLREAKALARLSHPNVVQIYEVGHQDGEVFIAMELIEGTVLTDWLAGAQRTWREVVDVFVEAARGLAAAHAQGVVHRDFKPDNVIVGENGRVRVVDFGLAIDEPGRPRVPSDADASLESGALLPGLTQTGVALGTPAYMAPEQMEGAPADPRADQFSWCVALYEALVGERPFDAPTLMEMRTRMLGEAPGWGPKRAWPVALQSVVARGLSVDPEQRHDSLDALIDALGRATGRDRRRTWGAGGLGLVAMLAGGLWWASEPDASSDTTEPAAAVVQAPAEGTASPEEDALVIEQAQTLLDVDPTAAVERLAALSQGAEAWSGRAWAVAAEAWDHGIARRTLSLPGADRLVATVGDRVLVEDEQRSELRLHDASGAVRWQHHADGEGPTAVARGSHVVFSDGGILTVAELEHGTTRGLGIELLPSDRIALARSGMVVMVRGDLVSIWGPGRSEPEVSTVPGGVHSTGLEVSAGGETVAVALSDNTVWVLHRPSGVVTSLPDGSFAMAVSDDGEQLVVRRTDGLLVRWRRGVEALEVLDESLRTLWPYAITADGRRLLAVDPATPVISWDLEAQQQRGSITTGRPRKVVPSPDGQRLAFLDGNLAVIATEGGRILRRLRQREPMTDVRWIDDDRVVTFAQEGKVRTWDVPKTVELVHAHREEVLALAFVPGHDVLLSAGVDRSVRRWDLQTGHDTTLATTGDMPLSMEVSSDGRHAMLALHGGQLLAWDLETEALVVGPEGSRGVAGFGSDHEVLFISDDGIAQWDLRTGEQRGINPAGRGCMALDTTTTGTIAGMCNWKGGPRELRVWALESETLIHYTPSRFLGQMILDPSGRRLVRDSGDGGPYELHSLIDDTPPVPLTGPRAFPLVFDPSGERLLGHDYGVVRESRPGTDISRVVREQEERVRELAYSAEGDRFALGSNDGRIEVFDAPVPAEANALRAWVGDAQPSRHSAPGPRD